jgi:hypothetical protein
LFNSLGEVKLSETLKIGLGKILIMTSLKVRIYITIKMAFKTVFNSFTF